jgi:hypothetical protein
MVAMRRAAVFFDGVFERLVGFEKVDVLAWRRLVRHVMGFKIGAGAEMGHDAEFI